MTKPFSVKVDSWSTQRLFYVLGRIIDTYNPDIPESEDRFVYRIISSVARGHVYLNYGSDHIITSSMRPLYSIITDEDVKGFA